MTGAETSARDLPPFGTQRTISAASCAALEMQVGGICQIVALVFSNHSLIITGGTSAAHKGSLASAGLLDLGNYNEGHAAARDAAGWFFVDTKGGDTCSGARFAHLEPLYHSRARCAACLWRGLHESHSRV